MAKAKKIFLKNVVKSDDPNTCWGWNGTTTNGFKGTKRAAIWLGGNVSRYVGAHRFVYEEYAERPPEDYGVSRTCKNTMCTNIQHLKAVPLSEYYLFLHNKRKAREALESTATLDVLKTGEVIFTFQGKQQANFKSKKEVEIFMRLIKGHLK